MFKSKYFITFYNYIFIYHTYKYVSYTYFTVYVGVFVCFDIVPLTSGVSFFVCGVPVILIYEVTNSYNDMGMTSITRIK